MKDLADKFDHLPQDFDREAIWEGIEKPKRPFFFQLYLWGAFLVIAFGVLYLLLTPAKPPISIPHQPRVDSIAACSEEGVVYLIESEGSNTSSEIPTQSETPLAPFQAHAKKKAKGKNVFANNGFAEHEAEVVEKIDPYQSKEAGLASMPQYESNGPSEIASVVEYLPKLDFYLKKSSDDYFFDGQRKMNIKQAKRSHSLSFRAGLGVHRVDFSSGDEESTKWRKDLEKPQMDYSLGLRYEYMFRNGYLISVTAAYHLYKDRINTEYIREEMVEDILVDYQLYNHYHLMSGQVEVGRRFYQKRFFWDVQAGVGLTYHQISEIDYFVEEGELADAAQIERAYRRESDMFFTGQAAIGKFLSPRLYVRTGIQVSSAKELTGSQAGIKHRIVPANAFLELGVRF